MNANEDSNAAFVPTGHFYSVIPSADTRQQTINSWQQRTSLKLAKIQRGLFLSSPFPSK